MARRRGMLTSWLAGGDLWRLQMGGFDWLSHVGPSEGCLTVRAVWKARLVLNPAGTGVTGGPGTRISEADWQSQGKRKYR